MSNKLKLSEKTQIELELLAEETYWVSEWLIRNGGSFATGIGLVTQQGTAGVPEIWHVDCKVLGEALTHADPVNQEKIRYMWPELWAEALKATEERRKNNDYY